MMMTTEDSRRRLPLLNHQDPNPNSTPNSNPNSNPAKRKRNLPGTPDPDAEVIAMSPKSLMATNRFMCEICNKGFQRDQNLQLHRRGHNLPWKLKQRSKEPVRKKVYICPETTCVHHDPARALGDLTGIKKHYSRKHGEKKWKCDRCAKKYAVQSDWKAHAKICGTREYKCDCGTLFSRKDSFITHRAFCDALAEESARFTPIPAANLNMRNEIMNGGLITGNTTSQFPGMFGGLEFQKTTRLPMLFDNNNNNNAVTGPPSNNLLPTTSLPELVAMTSQGQWFTGGNIINSSAATTTTTSAMLRAVLKEEHENNNNLIASSLYYNDVVDNNNNNNPSSAAAMSATALLQKATQIGSTTPNSGPIFGPGFGLMTASSFPQFSNPFSHNDQEYLIGDINSTKLQSQETPDSLTRDFLGVGSRPFLEEHDELVNFASSMDMSHYSRNL